MKVLLVIVVGFVGFGVLRWRLAVLEQRRFDRWLRDLDRSEWAKGIDSVRWTWPVKR